MLANFRNVRYSAEQAFRQTRSADPGGRLLATIGR